MTINPIIRPTVVRDIDKIMNLTLILYSLVNSSNNGCAAYIVEKIKKEVSANAIAICQNALSFVVYPLVSTVPPTIKQSIVLPYSIIRSEEHTSELQSRFDLVCRLLLEKKKITRQYLTCYIMNNTR